MNEQFVNISDIDTLRQVISRLNTLTRRELSFEVNVGNSNGEVVGRIELREGEYVFVFWALS